MRTLRGGMGVLKPSPLRILYCPVFAPGAYVELQRRTKRGLRDALARVGEVLQLDYLAISPADLENVLRIELTNFKPDLLFLQVQGTDRVTAQMLASIRVSYPDLLIANWNGDVYEEHLTSPDMLELLRQVDLQLVVNGSVLDTYAREGIRAAYCPFGYEASREVAPKVQTYDVVFLGNNYSAKRQQLYEALRSLNCRVGIFGSGWAQSEGECNYDFTHAEALYVHATLAISDNQFLDAAGYLSDRPFQVMGAGGAVLMQQKVRDLEAMTGLVAGKHYLEWQTIDELPFLIEEWLKPQWGIRRSILTNRAFKFVHEAHDWGNRVEQLLTEWLPELVGERA